MSSAQEDDHEGTPRGRHADTTRTPRGHHLIRPALVFLFAMVIVGGLNTVHVSSAFTACNSYVYWSRPQYAGYREYLACPGSYTSVNGWSTFCAPSQQQWTRVNNDEWQTNQPWTGGTRYVETGRTGLLGIPNDCSYHLMALGNSFPTPTPVWGCGWFYFADYAVAYDYQCGYIIG